MKKRTILGLCLSIFSLFLFSCGIAESNDGSATLNVDTATIVQRSIKSASFEVSEDEIFEQYAEYLNYELTAIVNYEIGGKSENKTFSLRKINGKEALELVEKLNNMSGEDQESYFTENFKSQTLTIENLPVGKTATFRMKIRQKIGFSDDLSKYEGLSESEISKDEYLAISKEPVTAKITESTDITIKLKEYDSSLDWDVVSWTLTGTFPSEWSSDLEFQNGEIFIYKKTGSTWNLVDTVILTSENPGFTVTSNRGTGSGTTKNLSTGDTAMLTIRMMYAYNESAGGHTCFAGWSKEVTCASGKNVFDMDEVTYKANFWGNPAPTTTASVLVTSENEITAKYGTIKVYKTDYSSETEQSTSTELLTKEIELSDCVKTSSSKDNSGYSSYQATYTFSDISAFSNVEEETMLNATLVLYEDSARTKQTNESQGGLSGFYKDCNNVFYFSIYDSSSGSEQTSSLEIRLFDETGTDAISLEDTTYYYALMITAEAADDITSVTPLYAEVSPTNTININLSGTQIADVISKGTVYFTFALFESQDDANSFIKTGELGNAKYFVTNQEVTFSSTTSTYESVILKLSPQA